MLIRFIFFLKSLFIKKSSLIKQESFDYKYSYEQLIKLDKPIKCSKTLQELFDCLNNGDIVYAHMPLSKEEMKQVPKGHRSRPYYLAYKLHDGFICYQISSNLSPRMPDLSSYSLSEFTYQDLTKASYLNLFKPYYLPKDHLINFICECTDKDFKEIQRRIWLTNPQEYEKLFKTKPTVAKAIIGDIVQCHNGKWVIVAEINDYYRVFRISRNNNKTVKNAVFVHCNFDIWKVNLNNELLIDKNEKFIVKHVINNGDLIMLKQRIKTEKGSCANFPNNIIFSLNNELYYCYNSKDAYLDAYKAYQNIENKQNLKLVEIKTKDFTYYLDTSSSIKIVDINNIKNPIRLERKYITMIKNSKKAKTARKYYTRYSMGTIFKDNKDEEYIYMFSNRSYDYCVKVNEYLNYELYPEYGLHEMKVISALRNGEVNDEELHQIIADQIKFGNDKENIFVAKIQLLNAARNKAKKMCKH